MMNRMEAAEQVKNISCVIVELKQCESLLLHGGLTEAALKTYRETLYRMAEAISGIALRVG